MVQRAKNEKRSETDHSSSPSRRDRPDTKGSFSSITKGLDRRWSVDEPPAQQALVSEGDRWIEHWNAEVTGEDEEEKKKKDTWMWMERRE
ncbi:hypothetical protein B9Z55_011872 [Caenorhabditis nigoni]|uniref:Uncharacterized protein n=1 Tax=Caenorhabditis nigoni TaxID=1611254 RepID=A0A2G5UM13_9PELO|nr:hypothetical protein B9Z55_011872 [Caenorhabditis nigoni]